MVTQQLKQGRRLRWWLAALAIVIGGVALCEWREWWFLQAPLERALASKLSREVSLGDGFGLRLLGAVRLRSAEVTVAHATDGPLPDPGRERSHLFLRASNATLVLPYLTVIALLRSQHDAALRISSLDVDRLELALVRLADGTANWHFRPPETRLVRPATQFDHLVVRDGRVSLDDALKQLVVDATVRTREDAATPSGFEASVVGTHRKAPLKIHVSSSGPLPLAVGSEDGPTWPCRLALRSGATELDLDGRCGDVLNLAAVDAEFRVAGPSLAAAGDAAGLTLPTTAAFVARGHVRRSGAVWQTSVREMLIGRSKLSGEFHYDARSSPRRLSGELGGARLALKDLGPAIGVGAPARTDASPGRLLPRRDFDVASLREMEADVKLKFDSVDLGTARLEPFAPVTARLRMQGKVLSLQDLSARAAGGELRGVVTIDAHEEVPRWSADLRWAGIRLDRFIKPRSASAADAASASVVGGALHGQARVQGRGRSAAAVLASLDGSSQMWVHEGHISQLFAKYAGGNVAKSLGLMVSGDQRLPVRCALARLSVRDGIMRPDVAVIDTPETTILVAGEMSLVDEKLALVMTARPKEMSLLSLRGPLHIEGTFSDPEVHMDGPTIGLRLVAAAALAAIAPMAALLPLVELGESEKAVCTDALQRLQRTPPARAAAAKAD